MNANESTDNNNNNNNPDDPYAVLGIPRDASDAAIRAAYRKAALRSHPDKVRDPADRPAATARFARIANAYEVLSNPELRAQYDQSSTQPPQQSYHNSAGAPRQPFADFHGMRFHDPFEVFQSVFAQEFYGNDVRPSSSGYHQSFRSPYQSSSNGVEAYDDPFFGRGGGGMFDDPFFHNHRSTRPFEDSFFGGGLFDDMSPFGRGRDPFMRGHRGSGGERGRPRDPFDDMFASMHDMQRQMEQQIMQQQQQSSRSSGGRHGTPSQSSFYYSSSSSTTGRGGETVTTQTTRQIVNGQEQSVTERIVRKPDGTVERQVLPSDNGGVAPTPALPPSTESTSSPQRWLPWRRSSRGASRDGRREP